MTRAVGDVVTVEWQGRPRTARVHRIGHAGGVFAHLWHAGHRTFGTRSIKIVQQRDVGTGAFNLIREVAQ